MGKGGLVLIFDFDQTIIDCDSDYWVVEHLGAYQSFNQLLPTMPFNSLMNRMMTELHSQGKTIDHIAEVLKRVPMHPSTVSGIKSAHALGCELRIVSDANRFFIETVLEHHGLMDCFSEINTNPSSLDEQGRLKIFPYYDFTKSSHGCALCPPNMCKGLIIERIQASVCGRESEKKKRIVYVGDGSGDYCPSLKLAEGDFVMPRKDFPVWDLICVNPLLLKAEIHEWRDWEELHRVLLHIINTVSAQSTFSDQCHLLQTSASVDVAHQILPQQPVPYH